MEKMLSIICVMLESLLIHAEMEIDRSYICNYRFSVDLCAFMPVDHIV